MVGQNKGNQNAMSNDDGGFNGKETTGLNPPPIYVNVVSTTPPDVAKSPSVKTSVVTKNRSVRHARLLYVSPSELAAATVENRIVWIETSLGPIPFISKWPIPKNHPPSFSLCEAVVQQLVQQLGNLHETLN